jgi:hypothetical protein
MVSLPAGQAGLPAGQAGLSNHKPVCRLAGFLVFYYFLIQIFVFYF